MKYIFTSVFICFTFLNLFGQDFQFLQGHLSPLNLNPALTGEEFNGRLISNYQYSWASFLQVANVHAGDFSYDRGIKLKNNDQIGLGVKTLGNFTTGNSFRHFLGSLSVSYQKNIANQSFSVGLEAGAAHLQELGLTWERPRFSPVLREGLFADIALGASYIGKFDFFKKVQLGAAVHHLNRADLSPDPNVENRLYRRWTFHALTEMQINDRILLQPRFFINAQGPSLELVYGADVRYLVRQTNPFSIGFGAQMNHSNRHLESLNNSSLVFITGIYFEKFGFTISRSWNASDLQSASDPTSAVEGSLIYKF